MDQSKTLDLLDAIGTILGDVSDSLNRIEKVHCKGLGLIALAIVTPHSGEPTPSQAALGLAIKEYIEHKEGD